MASNLRPGLARLLRRLADRLDPPQYIMGTDPSNGFDHSCTVRMKRDANGFVTLEDIEFQDALRREAAEFGITDECEAIKREQEAELKREWPRLRDEFKAACKENERRLRSVK